MPFIVTAVTAIAGAISGVLAAGGIGAALLRIGGTLLLSYAAQALMPKPQTTMQARSGTIRVRALVDNKDQLLTPGIFGRLQLFGGEYDALLVPDSAIISDQARKIVFVVGPGDVVQAKPVTLGTLVDGLRVIRSGLAPTDKVVLDGLANPMVRPGAKVVPQKGEIVAKAK